MIVVDGAALLEPSDFKHLSLRLTGPVGSWGRADGDQNAAPCRAVRLSAGLAV